MRGIGDRLSPPLVFAPLPAVLANPGVAVPTRDVFAALKAGPMASTERPQAERMDRGALEGFIAHEPNDLEPPAIGLQPLIATVLADLRAQAGCRLARMSGSGATCFGLFATEAAAAAAAAALQAAHPPWWVSATTLS
jgi:4-diphosphocytidyl-2-C-methyl-D-erythritol kinase